MPLRRHRAPTCRGISIGDLLLSTLRRLLPPRRRGPAAAEPVRREVYDASVAGDQPIDGRPAGSQFGHRIPRRVAGRAAQPQCAGACARSCTRLRRPTPASASPTTRPAPRPGRGDGAATTSRWSPRRGLRPVRIRRRGDGGTPYVIDTKGEKYEPRTEVPSYIGYGGPSRRWCRAPGWSSSRTGVPVDQPARRVPEDAPRGRLGEDAGEVIRRRSSAAPARGPSHRRRMTIAAGVVAAVLRCGPVRRSPTRTRPCSITRAARLRGAGRHARERTTRPSTGCTCSRRRRSRRQGREGRGHRQRGRGTGPRRLRRARASPGPARASCCPATARSSPV